MKASKNTAEADIGDCWTENRVFSSYDHHINSDPIYYYSIASGIDIKTMLTNLGVQAGNVEKMKVEGSDSYAFTFDKPFIFSHRYYFAPGTAAKANSVRPVIAFYKTTCGVKFTAEKGTVPSSAALVSDETNVFMPAIVDKIRSGETTAQETITDGKLLKRQRNALLEITKHPELTNAMRESLAVRLIAEEQSVYDKRTNWSDMTAKLGPILGLLGTLIPLGPGIIALGQGDTYTLSNALLTAFDTTVAGLT